MSEQNPTSPKPSPEKSASVISIAKPRAVAPAKATTRPATKAAVKTAAKVPVRRVSSGDTSGAKTTRDVVRRAIAASTDAAQSSKNTAIKSILKASGNKADALKTLLAGSSPDDVAAIRRMLLEGVLDRIKHADGSWMKDTGKVAKKVIKVGKERTMELEADVLDLGGRDLIVGITCLIKEEAVIDCLQYKITLPDEEQ